jgi:hypothetical protein
MRNCVFTAGTRRPSLSPGLRRRSLSGAAVIQSSDRGEGQTWYGSLRGAGFARGTVDSQLPGNETFETEIETFRGKPCYAGQNHCTKWNKMKALSFRPRCTNDLRQMKKFHFIFRRRISSRLRGSTMIRHHQNFQLACRRPFRLGFPPCLGPPCARWTTRFCID